MTGFSDPIYAEAYVNVNQYDIVLDVLIVNQTSDTLQNVTLELATLGKIFYLSTHLRSRGASILRIGYSDDLFT